MCSELKSLDIAFIVKMLSKYLSNLGQIFEKEPSELFSIHGEQRRQEIKPIRDPWIY